MSESDGGTKVHYTEIKLGDTIFHPWTKQWSTVTGIDVNQSTSVYSRGAHDETLAMYEGSRTFHFGQGVDVQSWEYKPDGMVPRRQK
ncbi:hypothetical protein D2E42_24000 [Mycobacteroides abscessus]|uniref:hypothetical protein n=1 Tax=Mycobacteroides abscessus TaxID=36809 RepID=UPI000D3E3263|nr:hypothetical protein [Mycobacteroides abscessus]PVB47832.1 hypothetical protein DDK10_24015 [Mycobacteroides abscessus]RIR66533.1 hypothetical protein D2E42_24000 [Mycobacteroides abscessus]